jgi:hypothetical protein
MGTIPVRKINFIWKVNAPCLIYQHLATWTQGFPGVFLAGYASVEAMAVLGSSP